MRLAASLLVPSRVYLLGIDVSGLNVPLNTGCTPIDILKGASVGEHLLSTAFGTSTDFAL
jgi:hypothetical protein